MSSIVDETKILASMDSSTGLVTMEIVGNSSVYNGQHIKYYVSSDFCKTTHCARYKAVLT
jgi:hypothetical protein